MGVSILASRRHPNVVVMAPALTEAGQSQNFKTLPSTTSKNRSNGCDLTPAVLSESSKHNQICKLVVSEFKKNIKLFNDPNKEFDDTIKKHKSNGALKKSPDQLPSELCNIDTRELEACEAYGITGENSSMNDSAPMGDRSDNMGLLKSSNRGSSASDDQTEVADFPKANGQNAETKEKNDMDQLLKNFSAAISGGELSSGDFPAPNVEELLQVIKSMENTCETSDPVLDAPGDAGEAEGIFPLSGTDFASFEREILDDMMTFDDHLPDSGLDVKESWTKEKLDEAHKRQFEIERKCERLQRRLKKLQTRCLGKHAGEEITGLFEHAHRLVRQGFQAASSTSVGAEDKDRKGKGVSEAALSSLADRLAASSSDQGSGYAKYRPPVKYFGSGSVDIAQQDNALPGSILPKLPREDKEEVKAVAQQLYSQVHFLQNHLDSDVTASSSGGESCDEMQSFNNPHQSHQSIGNRALWRWSQDRAGVACRWTWLQAQISDLEYKIRQHAKNHRQNWMAKGQMQSEEDANARRSQQRNPAPLSVNGYHGALPGALKPLKPNEEVLNGTIPFQSSNCDPTMTACRTRPFVKSAYRKRKLLQMAGLHLVSKKAARPVTVRCGCHPPTSCALCTGRSDPSKVERLEPSTLSEKIALLDYSFHPVLSFPSDASLSLHLDAVMRLHEWQAKANRCNIKFNRRSPDKEKEDFRHERRQKLKRKLNFSDRKNLRKIRKHTANVLSAKLKKKLSARERKRRDLTKSEHLPLPLLKIKKTRKQSLKFDLDGESDEDGELYVETVSVDREDRSSRCDSPVGPLVSSKDKSEKRERDRSEDGRRRKEDDSYDIDNIVIPYSMAASTRVEKLQYKEILTPKWRIVDVFDLPTSNFDEDSKKPGQESETEDISDEAFLERHTRCEESEKKKFMSYIKLPLAVRSRANRRTDSRAESSGANTPDPMSPLNPDHADLGGAVSPLTTPPATPLSVVEEPCLQANIRRRTVSNSRWHAKEKLDRTIVEKEKDDRCLSPDFEDEVQPYEPRIYPLPEEVYEEMLKDMPSDHVQYMSFQRIPKDYEGDHRMPESPSTSSTISAVEEDPNDPEWTVVNVRDVKDDLEYRNRNKR